MPSDGLEAVDLVCPGQSSKLNIRYATNEGMANLRAYISGQSSRTHELG